MRLTIGTKVLCGLVGLFAVLTTANYTVQRATVMKQFQVLEDQAARDDLRRCREAILRELEHVSTLARDWSTWDDPYQFMVDRNAAFAESNLQESMWKTSCVSLLYFVDLEGNIIWGDGRDVDFEKHYKPASLDVAKLPAEHYLLAHRSPAEKDGAVFGIENSDHGPMLICARPIVNSAGDQPARGTLIMGRFLTKDTLATLREQTRVQFEVFPTDSAAKPATAAAALAKLKTTDDLLISPQDDQVVLAHAYLNDPLGRPALLIEATIPRAITAEGSATMRLALMWMMGAAVLTCLLTHGLLSRLVVDPLRHLTERTTHIGQTGDLSQRLQSNRADEIGVLSRAFDGMIEKLADLRGKLLESSRRAGMADVASGVLHNVGNVLNSLNISTTMLVESVKKSKVTGLSRAVELMERNRGNIGEFLTQDERGRTLPSYLTQLAQALGNEQRAMLSELGTLRTSVDHINQVVQSQHTFATKVGHVEPARLTDIVNNSVAIMEAAFKRHGIEVQTALAESPLIKLDAAKCMQVVVNLLTNAKEAVGAMGKGEKLIRVRLRVNDGDSAEIEVSDNGVGIAPENIERIFATGFTTKPNGRGYGLHYCANAARELGGELSATSDGPGRGACFTLRIPINVVEASGAK